MGFRSWNHLLLCRCLGQRPSRGMSPVYSHCLELELTLQIIANGTFASLLKSKYILTI